MSKIANGILIGTALAIIVFALWVFIGPVDADLADTLTSLALILISLLTSTFGFVIAAQGTLPASLRRAWGLLALANISGAIAEMIWAYFSAVLQIDPFPSIADAFYLLVYPLLLAGILSLPYAPSRREQRLLLNIDLGIVVLVCAVFLWYFILANLIRQGGQDLSTLIALAYPLADLLILSGLFSMFQRDVEAVGRTVLRLLISGILVTILADIIFAVVETYQLSYPSGPLNGLWLVGRWAILAAVTWQVTHPSVEATDEPRFRPLLRTSLLYIAVLTGTGLALLAALNLNSPDLRLNGTLFGSLGIVGLVLLRQYLVLQDNRRLTQEMERLAITDALTGIANRLYFNQALAREIAHARRYKRQLALLLVDIDDFKAYNDLHGHLEGDRLLHEFGALLKTQLRTSDVAARYGGDEFVIILPEADLAKAGAVAEKLRLAASTLVPGEAVSVSIGCATLQPDMSAVTLLELADQDMYRDKSRRASEG